MINCSFFYIICILIVKKTKNYIVFIFNNELIIINLSLCLNSCYDFSWLLHVYPFSATASDSFENKAVVQIVSFQTTLHFNVRRNLIWWSIFRTIERESSSCFVVESTMAVNSQAWCKGPMNRMLVLCTKLEVNTMRIRII